MPLDWLVGVNRRPCTFYDDRPTGEEVSLLVIHNISLPAGEFGTPYVDGLFCGTLDYNAHASFVDLQGVEVSAHCFIKRDGQVLQYVPFSKRAWHAGVSTFAGRTRCNDFSIGIELEGTDDCAYEQVQYLQLVELTKQLMTAYPAITKQRIVGHCDIAPGRKTDPGSAFQWSKFFHQLDK
ncbi:1,6-anhydro-N-acetylmuramyl-L-alanine amidase AmpD [Pseudoalteromonas holothuriae]|uniref:1,6-anhydro-N-acetylmuramyl-L-alanine amidase AmpD n=1 Tax=Pseudoalteromonas holothuriae TaxID=2963714 RepID=A0A9W4VYP2_9GAMM|nr:MULTISPECIES: 1,6-anhydro-N-acetylmuramyl-L-alanine amidase AmpD [unclassified Pseudoalteromonas]CAH9053070.1 1,6-anhydro-N-acetylmuramyl-L-alanine amidase AmpD [Pseudoalteromonas sp. CIP111951]CAH9056456.1 1,6-anhydro-N-acetylmuramyl-L-alanine amidase AmpD [Pseudoalteromonas sp. CIP111854]